MGSVLATLLVAAALGGGFPTLVEERPPVVDCLAPREARGAVANGSALDFPRIKRIVERRSGGEVLRARLCRIDGRLRYSLTVLQAGGQVVIMVVEAGDGAHSSAGPQPRPPRLERRSHAAVSGDN